MRNFRNLEDDCRLFSKTSGDDLGKFLLLCFIVLQDLFGLPLLLFGEGEAAGVRRFRKARLWKSRSSSYVAASF